MVSTFFDRIDELSEAVGTGELKGSVEVDQIYAHYQHEGTDFDHPRGGEAHFLRDPLFQHSDEYMKTLADRAITEDGSEITEAMIDNMEALSTQVEIHAPREFGDLEDSGHPKVTSNGDVVYDRAPKQHRLSEEELKHKRQGLDEHGKPRTRRVPK